MTLAMFSHSQLPDKMSAGSHDDSIKIVRAPANTSVQETKLNASKLKVENDSPAYLEKPASHQRNPLIFVHENLRAAKSFEVCVGCERLWDDSVILPKISGRQDMGCAGVKASFSF